MPAPSTAPAAPGKKTETGAVSPNQSVVQFEAPAGASVTINGSLLGQSKEERRFVFTTSAGAQPSLWHVNVAIQNGAVTRTFDKWVSLKAGEESLVDLGASSTNTVASK
jgi:hypothetical protein